MCGARGEASLSVGKETKGIGRSVGRTFFFFFGLDTPPQKKKIETLENI